MEWFFKKYDLNCDEEVIHYLSSLTFKNLGEIESRIRNVKFYADIMKKDVDLEVVEKSLYP